jgi:hypothetical protein
MRTEKGALPYRHTPCTGPAPLVAAIHPGDDALLSLAGQLPNKTTTPPSPSFPLCSGCNDNARATRLPPPPQQRMTEKRDRGRPPQALVELVPRLIRRGGGAPTKRNWHWRWRTGRDGQAFASACSTTRRFSFFTLAREGGREGTRSFARTV